MRREHTPSPAMCRHYRPNPLNSVGFLAKGAPQCLQSFTNLDNVYLHLTEIKRTLSAFQSGVAGIDQQDIEAVFDQHGWRHEGVEVSS